jgi:hypothetical protein
MRQHVSRFFINNNGAFSVCGDLFHGALTNAFTLAKKDENSTLPGRSSPLGMPLQQMRAKVLYCQKAFSERELVSVLGKFQQILGSPDHDESRAQNKPASTNSNEPLNLWDHRQNFGILPAEA